MGFRRYIKCLPDGYSLGGLTSAITSPENMDYIKAEILFYPAFVIQDAAAELYAMGDDMPETFEITGVTLGRDLVEATVNYDLYAQAEKFTKDVLLIHGDADPVVPIQYSEHLRDELASVEYHVIKDGVHSFQGEHFEQAISTPVELKLKESIGGKKKIIGVLNHSSSFIVGSSSNSTYSI